MSAILLPTSWTMETSGSAPATPPSGDVVLYSKTSDKKVYWKDDAGVEHPATAGLTITDEQGNVSISDVQTLIVPRGTLANPAANQAQLFLMPRSDKRRQTLVNCSGTAFSTSGQAAITADGTLSSSNQSDTSFTACVTAASANSLGGFHPSTFNWCQPRHDPYFSVIVQVTGTLTAMRLWFGLFPSAPTTDTPPNNSVFWRYSDVAGDAGFKFQTRDNGGTNNVTAQIGANIAANTTYKFEFWFTNAGTHLYYRKDGGSVTELVGNLPAVTTDLGLIVRVLTNGAAARTLRVSRCYADAA